MQNILLYENDNVTCQFYQNVDYFSGNIYLCGAVSKSFVFLFGYTVVALCLHTVTRLALWKWGHFERAKFTLKILTASWTVDMILEGA